MKKFFRCSVFMFFISLFVFSCKKEIKQQVKPAGIEAAYLIDCVTFQKALTEYIATMDSALQARYLQIYQPKGMNSFWFSDLTRADEKIQWLNDVISKSMEHGINPEHFGMKKVLNFTSKLNFQEPDYRKLAETELLLTDAYYTYCSGMQYGFFDPVKLYPKDYFIHMQQPDSAFIRLIFSNSDSLKVYLDKVQPKLPEYKALQSEMQKLLVLKDSVLPEIPSLKPKKTIKVGNTHPSVPLVARRLMITGELAFTHDADSVYQVFNDTLLTALNKFRRKYNLLTDKEIGNKTIEALNRDFESQYWVVIANLERLRWKPAKDISNKYVHVNVANMTLQALREDTLIKTMKVVVGKPPKHKTPLLYGKMYEVVLNPTWTVPNSIIINEISRLMMTDTLYLRRNHMKIYKNRVPINEWDIPWSRLSNTYQPYVIVQDAGPGNSLGKLKFNFTNPFNVYLHDTNSKSAFDLHYRGLSHGCVRVEKPLELAFFCLHDIDSTDRTQVKDNNILKDRIRYSIGLNPETEEGKKALKDVADKQKLKRVELKPGVTVLLDYRTCFTGENGEVQFCNDHYNMDSLLVAKLKNIH